MDLSTISLSISVLQHISKQNKWFFAGLFLSEILLLNGVCNYCARANKIVGLSVNISVQPIITLQFEK